MFTVYRYAEYESGEKSKYSQLTFPKLVQEKNKLQYQKNTENKDY